MINNPIKIVQQLRIAKGGNAKLKILQSEADNHEWKEILKAMYDKSINYYIGPPTDRTFVNDPINFKQMMYNLSELSNRTYTGNAAKEVALEGSQTYGEIYRLILEGTLKAGVSDGLIEKAYPGLIPQWKVMKGNTKAEPNYPVLGSIKYDGVRLLVFVTSGGVKVKTSHGKDLRIISLERSMSRLPPGVYDGEIVLGSGMVKERSSISGLVTKCIRGTKSDIASKYTFCVFDVMSLKSWETKKDNTKFIDRTIFLGQILQNISNVLAVDQVRIDNKDQEQRWFNSLIKKGYEGLILRYEEDPYIWGRSDRLIKRKAVLEATLKVIGVTEGKEGTRTEGLIGSLISEGYVEDTFVKVDVGPGLSDWDREQDPEYFIGKTIEVQYNSITKAKDKDFSSLFLARYKRIQGGE